MAFHYHHLCLIEKVDSPKKLESWEWNEYFLDALIYYLNWIMGSMTKYLLGE